MNGKKRNQIIMIASVVVSLALVCGLYIMGTSKVSTVIGLQFDGIEKGLNPDDTRFDYNEIISEAVLEKIVTSGGFEYKTEIKGLFSIKPILPLGIVETIESKSISGDDYKYFPSEFKITLTVDKGLGVTKEVAMAIMEQFERGYAEFFLEEYKYPFLNLQQMLSYFNYASYDYPELTKVFRKEFNMIQSYLEVLVEDDPEYITSNGYSFRDLQETIKITKELDLNQIDALVNAYELTNDIDELVIKYEFMIKRYELEKNKKDEQYKTSDGIIAVLEANKSIMVVQGIGGEAMSISKLDEVYDTIVARAVETKLSSGELNEEIIHLEGELEKLYNSRPETAEIVAAKVEVNQLVEKLNDKILTWVGMIEGAAGAYFSDKYESSVILVDVAKVENSTSALKLLVIWVVVVVGLVVLLSFGFGLVMRNVDKNAKKI